MEIRPRPTPDRSLTLLFVKKVNLNLEKKKKVCKGKFVCTISLASANLKTRAEINTLCKYVKTYPVKRSKAAKKDTQMYAKDLQQKRNVGLE